MGPGSGESAERAAAHRQTGESPLTALNVTQSLCMYIAGKNDYTFLTVSARWLRQPLEFARPDKRLLCSAAASGSVSLYRQASRTKIISHSWSIASGLSIYSVFSEI